VAIGRAQRWAERLPRIVATFGDDKRTLEHVAAVFDLMEMAWHDCYGEPTPSEDIVDQVLVCSGGTLGGLVEASRLAVRDRRDLQLWADDLRAREGT
jgi:hypothetical protein